MAFKRKGSYKRYYSKKYKKRRYSTNKRIRPSIGYMPLVNKANGVMPAIFKTKFTFNTTYTLVGSLGGGQDYRFRGNSVFDPDESGLGSTAAGVSQLSNIYTAYCVTSSAIEVSFINKGGSACICFIVPYISATNLALGSAKSLPYYKEAIIQNDAAGGSIKKVIHYAKTKDILGIANFDSDTRAGFTTNPNQQWYWIVGMQPADFQTAATVVISVKLTYYCECSGLKILNA